MTVVSSKDFATNQKKYFDMARNEEVCIKRGNSMFHLIHRPVEVQYPEQTILEPDDDLRRAIPLEEVRDRVIDYIRKKHANQL